MKKVLTILFLFVYVLNYSQENDQKEIIDIYSKKLKLNTTETEKMASIMAFYKKDLYSNDIYNQQFNATLKLQTLEIYKLLRKKRFSSYLKLRSKYQPELNYRLN